jgi:hypothetical protein
LPLQVTRFIGRGAKSPKCVNYRARAALTLLGMGGLGKTHWP